MWNTVLQTRVRNEVNRKMATPIGNTYFVDSVNGNSAYSGNSWKHPLATLNEAVAKATANNGDVIFLAPWHTESIAAAGSIATLSKAGVIVVGLGEGDQMPTFSLGHADGTMTVSGANVALLGGIKIKSTVADVKVGLTVAATANGSIIKGLKFRDDAAAKELLIGLSVAAGATDLTIEGNDFLTTAAAGSANAIKMLGGHTGSVVKDNVVYGKYSAGAVHASTALSLGIKIEGNRLVNAEAALALGLHTSCTGILANNYLGGTTSIAAALTGENAMWCFNNYVTGAAAASGIIYPTVDAD